MLSVRKTWPARVITAMMALALGLASTFAAYAHAAGHQHAAGHHHHAAGHVAHAIHTHDSHAGKPPGHSASASGYELEHSDSDSAGSSDSCSILCTGALAILVAAAVIEHPLAAAPAAEPKGLLDSAEPIGLERPPKSAVPA
jgi:hypothetical protein